MTTQQIIHGSHTLKKKKMIISYEIPLYALLNPTPFNLILSLKF